MHQLMAQICKQTERQNTWTEYPVNEYLVRNKPLGAVVLEENN